MIVILCGWPYLHYLVSFVLRYLTELKNNNLLTNNPFIPDSEVYLKTDGDHGGEMVAFFSKILLGRHDCRLNFFSLKI